jgi:hypothetical protein
MLVRPGEHTSAGLCISAAGAADDIFFFRHKIHFRHNRFSTLFFSMKGAESGKIVLVICIIEFKDKQI